MEGTSVSLFETDFSCAGSEGRKRFARQFRRSSQAVRCYFANFVTGFRLIASVLTFSIRELEMRSVKQVSLLVVLGLLLALTVSVTGAQDRVRLR